MLAAPQARHERGARRHFRSEEHTSELQSQSNLVCRLLLEKKKQAAAALLLGLRLWGGRAIPPLAQTRVASVQSARCPPDPLSLLPAHAPARPPPRPAAAAA